MCERLLALGTPVIELTATTPDWPSVLNGLRRTSPGTTIGVGTVTTPETARSAVGEGAAFLVSPYPAAGVRAVADDHGVPFIEGGFTPGSWPSTAVGVAKLFPASSGGIRHLKAVLDVLPGARVIPTGGIALDQVGDWLAAGAYAVGVGTDLATRPDAAYLARSAPASAVAVEFVTITGDDPYSAQMRETWRAYGVGDTLAATLPGGRPGLYLIRLDVDGERTFYHYRAESAARGLFGPDHPASVDGAIAACDLVYLSAITLSIVTAAARQRLLRVLAAARARGTRVVFDSNYRPAGWSSPAQAAAAIPETLTHTDIALPTLSDEQAVFGDADASCCVKRLQTAGVREIVVKLGAAGGGARGQRARGRGRGHARCLAAAERVLVAGRPGGRATSAQASLTANPM
jgi:Entner-Doudoroff aldolase